MSDSGIPLYAQFCSNCNLSREMATQCRKKPLRSVFIGNGPKDGFSSPLLVGNPAAGAGTTPGGMVVTLEPKFVPVAAPTFANYWCRSWREMQEDHPDHPSRQRLVPRDFSTMFTPEKPS